MNGLLFDTSAVIEDLETALEDSAQGAISVITLGELRAGVTLAHDPTIRAGRQARLAALRATFAPLPVDEQVADHYGDALAAARSAGRITNATDLLIVATARATGRALITRDRRQGALADEVGVPVRGPREL